MAGAAQNWAMPILQALDEGRAHDLLINYDAFREVVIAMFRNIDRRGNAEDQLGKNLTDKIAGDLHFCV